MIAAPTSVLYSVTGTTDTAGLVATMLAVWFPDATTVVDMTYGNGKFWGPEPPVAVTGVDIDPARARDECADFTGLPFADHSFDVAVFDPPYHTDMGRGKASVMGSRFGTYPTIDALRGAVHSGCVEARRVSRLGVIVKVQNYIHASQLVHMTDWVQKSMLLPLYDEVHQTRGHKIIDPKWQEQLSAYRNHATWLCFRHDGPIHRRRKV